MELQKIQELLRKNKLDIAIQLLLEFSLNAHYTNFYNSVIKFNSRYNRVRTAKVNEEITDKKFDEEYNRITQGLLMLIESIHNANNSFCKSINITEEQLILIKEIPNQYLEETIELISDLFPAKISSERIIRDSGINPNRINFDSPPIDRWFKIIEEANRTHDTIGNLLKNINNKYPKNIKLQALLKKLIESYNIG